MSYNTEVVFVLDYMSLRSLVHLANAAAYDLKDYDAADIAESELDSMRNRFNQIADRIDFLVQKVGSDINGPIPKDWQISDHVYCPENL